MSVAVQNTFGPYKIISPLGAGGMGEVFLAEDTRLERKVAIKLLADEYKYDSDKLERFRQEARAASALNHPNILTIYEIGAAEDETHFIVAEYVEGETLREKISAGSLSLDDILHIAVQTVEALAAAHAAHIIHRDIKPENIMIRRDGYIKILDFGLAKLFDRTGSGEIEPEADTRKLFDTDPNLVMGTAKYMSPEQIRGSRDIDARSDIFSFGSVLYEILTGRSPFAAETVPDILAGVLHKNPLPLKEYAPDVPDDLQRIVGRALEKNREQRYRSAADLLRDLKALRDRLILEAREKRDVESVQSSILPQISGGSAEMKESILVSEFENLTGDPVFDHTLTTALAFTLEQSPFLHIFPDSRVGDTLRLMGRRPDERITSEIGREICLRQGVKAYIKGTIAGLGAVYVLTLEAVNAQTGEVIGRQLEQADSKEEVLVKLGKAASGLREKLGESLSSIEKFPALCDRTTSSLEALKLYSLGVRYTDEGRYAEAISILEKAIELDPEFAIAYVKLAAIYVNIAQPKEAARYGKKAFELAGGVSEMERLRITDFYYTFITGEFDKSIETINLLKLSYPQNTQPYISLSDRFYRIGQFEKAVEAARQAVRLSPDNYTGYLNLAEPLIALNRFAEAEEVFEKAAEKGLDPVFTHRCLYRVAFCRQDLDSMQRHLERIRELGDEHTALDLEARAAAVLGRWNQARDFTRRAVILAAADGRPAMAARYEAKEALRTAFLMTAAEDLSIDERFPAEIGQQIKRSLDFERNQITLTRAALALAFAGDTKEAGNLIGELEIEYPQDTLINRLWIPTVRAAVRLRQNDPSAALEQLEIAGRFERAAGFYPQYLRALAFGRLNDTERALEQIDKIVNRCGEGPLSVLYPLAKLAKARLRQNAGEFERFFRYWKDADEDLPALVRARRDYDNL